MQVWHMRTASTVLGLIQADRVVPGIGPDPRIITDGEMFMTSAARIRAGAILACGVAAFGVNRARAADVSVASASAQSAIEAAVAKERKVYGGNTPVPGVLIGVWDHAGNSYIRGFGDADLATHRAMTRADHFRIGSNTKTFVISVLLQLVDEGKLGFDDKLSKFDLGVAIPNAENITVRELCEMRSGLFEAYDTPEIDRMKITPDMKFDARTLVGWAVQQKPLFAPGTKYNLEFRVSAALSAPSGVKFFVACWPFRVTARPRS